MQIGPWIATNVVGGRLVYPSLGAAGLAPGTSTHLFYAALCFGLATSLVYYRRQRLDAESLRRQELRLRREALAYLLFNGSLQTMVPSEFARQLSRLIAARSSFHRAALLLPPAEGGLAVAGSAGMDDLAVQALDRWGKDLHCDGKGLPEGIPPGDRIGTVSFHLQLERRIAGERSPLSAMCCSEVNVIPLRTSRSLLGALVVCARPRPNLAPADLPGSAAAPPLRAQLPLRELLEPLEALALRLTLQLAAPETGSVRANLSGSTRSQTSSRHFVHLRERHARGLHVPAPADPRPSDSHPAAALHDVKTTGKAHGVPTIPATPPKPIRLASSPLLETEALPHGLPSRRTLDQASHPLAPISTADALQSLLQRIDPAAPPLLRVTGSVSGRPPARLWKTSRPGS